MYPLDLRIVIIKKGEIVEAMTSKIILMMPKNLELSKFQRIRSQKASRIIKFQESRFENNQDQDSRIKRRLNQDKYSKSFSKHWVAQEFFTNSFTKEFYSLVIDYQKVVIDYQ